MNTRLFSKDNSELDAKGSTPFAEVVEGMDVVDKLFSGYGETLEESPSSGGPSAKAIESRGNKYLQIEFPKLSYIQAVQASEIEVARLALLPFDSGSKLKSTIFNSVYWLAHLYANDST